MNCFIPHSASLYKSPWCRIYTYRGSRVRHSGEFVRQEIARYPNISSNPSTNTIDCYAPVIIPAKKVHISVGVSPPPGAIIALHGIPAQYPLAMTYIEVLTSLHRHGFEYRESNGDDDMSHGSTSSKDYTQTVSQDVLETLTYISPMCR